MRVQDLMQTTVHTVKEDDTVDRIFFLINFEKIRHIPVLRRSQVVGIVSDRDLFKALGSRPNPTAPPEEETKLYVRPKRARHIMRRGVFTITPDAKLSEAADLMAKRKIGALPVTEKGKLVGIITSTDLLKAFAKLAADLNKLMGSH